MFAFTMAFAVDPSELGKQPYGRQSGSDILTSTGIRPRSGNSTDTEKRLIRSCEENAKLQAEACTTTESSVFSKVVQASACSLWAQSHFLHSALVSGFRDQSNFHFPAPFPVEIRMSESALFVSRLVLLWVFSVCSLAVRAA